MHVRIQSWFPFTIQIYMNGHEIIAKKLASEDIEYNMYDNSFTFIDHLPKAQKFAQLLERKNWKSTFNRFAKIVNPHLGKIHRITSRGYYWSIAQCEISTDVMFDGRDFVEHIYPDFIEHASRCLKAEDILAFFGKKYHGLFKGEITTDRKKRPQGFRVKHRVKKNSIKMYDKWSVLRIETTVNNPLEFKVYRQVIRKGKKTKAWVTMGKGITNLYALAQIGKKANNRYLDMLANIPITAHHITDVERICEPITFKSRRYSSFNPMSEKCSQIFLTLLNGAYAVNGFSNKDIRITLFGSKKVNDPKISGQITRLLAKFRAHHLIAKIPRSFRYRVTEKGYLIMSSILRLKKIEYPLLMAA